MGETLTVRLFVSTQTYDIPCDPRQPAKWLLQQAKNIKRANHTPQQNPQKPHHGSPIQEELEVLYNRSRRLVIDLEEPIGRSISAMDVIDARTLLQTPDMTNTSALFPWLNSYSGGPKVNDENLNSANGLFFQQLYAYTLIGRKTPQTASQRHEKQKRDKFLDLLKAYVVGSFQDDQPQIDVGYSNGYHGQYAGNKPGHHHQQQQPKYYRPLTPQAPPANSALHGMPARRASDFPTSTTSKSFFSAAASTSTGSTPTQTAPSTPAQPVRRQIEYADSDSNSDHADEGNFAQRMISLAIGGGSGDVTPSRGAPRNSLPPVSPSPTIASQATPTTPVRRVTIDATGNPLDEMESVFDIVFKQQAIGMKLASDEYKQYAVVKECFDGSEAKKYPEIQNGVVILAVNGQEVHGLGLSRLLYRLREAPRPVVVRFGRIAHRGDTEDRHSRSGTWG